MDCLHQCYVIETSTRKASYVGYSIDPDRRIQQHNGILVGGAKRTTRIKRTTKDTWEFLMIIENASPDWGKHEALSMEWHLKGRRISKSKRGWRDTGGAHATTNRRIGLLTKTLNNPKFNDFLASMTIWVRDDQVDNVFAAVIDDVPGNVVVMPLSERESSYKNYHPFYYTRYGKGQVQV